MEVRPSRGDGGAPTHIRCCEGINSGGGSTLTHVVFDPPIHVTPGAQYVIAVEQAPTVNELNLRFELVGDPDGAGAYANRRAIIGGTPVPSNDFSFREGTIPEPASGSMLWAAVTFIGARRRQLPHR